MTSRTDRTIGFTLVELMLVLVIIGIVTAVGAPTFVRSIRGNRLRVAASSVVRAGKYARSMAIMTRKEVRLTFHPAAARIEARGAEGVALDRLLDGVRIDGIAVGGGGSQKDGAVSIAYARNGRCTPYSVTIADKREERITVFVDALGGTRTEGGNP